MVVTRRVSILAMAWRLPHSNWPSLARSRPWDAVTRSHTELQSVYLRGSPTLFAALFCVTRLVVTRRCHAVSRDTRAVMWPAIVMLRSYLLRLLSLILAPGCKLAAHVSAPYFCNAKIFDGFKNIIFVCWISGMEIYDEVSGIEMDMSFHKNNIE